MLLRRKQADGARMFGQMTALVRCLSTVILLIGLAVSGGLSQTPGLDGTVRALTVHDGDLIAGGEFTHADGLTVNHVARWDGEEWHALGSGLQGTVFALASYYGDLYAGGKFTFPNGQNLARWNGSAWVPAGNPNDTVYALYAWSGELYVGGSFTTFDGSTILRCAKWVSGSGGSKISADADFDFPVHCFAGQGTWLLIGGHFSRIGSTSYHKVVAWDRFDWIPIAPNHPLDNIVYGMYEQPGAPGLFIGGAFNLNWEGGPRFVAVQQEGASNWYKPVSGAEPWHIVRCLAGWNDMVAVGGTFDSIGTARATGVALYNGTSWLTMDPGTNAKAVYALQDMGDQLIVAGEFDLVGADEHRANNIAAWTGTEWLELAGNSDGDTIPDALDNCPFVDNNDQSNSDYPADDHGDACDICPGYNDYLDTDQDGVPNGCDKCEGVNDSIDYDEDGYPDACDNCPEIANNQADYDCDGIGNACDDNVCDSSSSGTWARHYGCGIGEVAFGVVARSDGGFVLAGREGAGGQLLITRLDACGLLESRTLSGVQFGAYGYGVIPAIGGGYLVAGRSNYVGVNTFLLKADATGDIQWTTQMGSTGDDDLHYGVAQLANGRIWAVGYSKSAGDHLGDILVNGYTSSGDYSSTRLFRHDGGSETGRAIIRTQDNKLLIAGDESNDGTDYFLYKKLNTDGSIIWERRVPAVLWKVGGANAQLYSADTTADGGFVVAGTGESIMMMRKINDSGIAVWERTYGGNSSVARAVKLDTDGGFIVAGFSNAFGTGDYDFYVVKTDPNGVPLWDTTFGGEYDDRAYSVDLTPDGKYVVAGQTSGDDSQMYVVKFGIPCCLGMTGNINDDPYEQVDLSDLTYMTNWLFQGGPPPECLEEADVNLDGYTDLSDMIYLTNYLFNGGAAPASCQ